MNFALLVPVRFKMDFVQMEIEQFREVALSKILTVGLIGAVRITVQK